jgi:hypothetical protein
VDDTIKTPQKLVLFFCCKRLLIVTSKGLFSQA